jgi:predicted nucleic acid-binding protein
MIVFVDTSGILSVMNTDDQYHTAGAALWYQWIKERPQLITSNYVILETVSLLQRRMGSDLHSVFTFDRHFDEQGLMCLP